MFEAGTVKTRQFFKVVKTWKLKIEFIFQKWLIDNQDFVKFL